MCYSSWSDRGAIQVLNTDDFYLSLTRLFSLDSLTIGSRPSILVSSWPSCLLAQCTPMASLSLSKLSSLDSWLLTLWLLVFDLRFLTLLDPLVCLLWSLSLSLKVLFSWLLTLWLLVLDPWFLTLLDPLAQWRHRHEFLPSRMIRMHRRRRRRSRYIDACRPERHATQRERERETIQKNSASGCSVSYVA